jgi:hypothetical protein
MGMGSMFEGASSFHKKCRIVDFCLRTTRLSHGWAACLKREASSFRQEISNGDAS